jgi:MFS transporter, FSR family, fosmidomycin resistance protein
MIVTSIPTALENENEEFQTSDILTVVGGHFMHDTYSAFVSPLLPLLIEKLSLSYTLAGSLAVFVQLPSLFSVLIGYLADRFDVRYLVIFAPAITATLATMIGFMPTYTAAAILLFSMGVSVMAFHAPAPAMVAHISGRRVGRGMSFFMAGGELGRSLGPLLVGFGVAQWGMEGLWRLMFFGWIASFFLYFRLKDVSAQSKRKKTDDRKAFFKTFARVFVPLFVVMIFRNFVVNGLSLYMVTFLTETREYTLPLATGMLAIYELAGVAGALTGGTLSDRLGRKKTIMLMGLLSAIFAYAFVSVDNWLQLPLLILLGLTALSVTPIYQALVQDQLPNNRATASGMFIFYAFIVRAINVILVGILADAVGLSSALLLAAGVSLLAIPMVFLLPNPPKEQESLAR